MTKTLSKSEKDVQLVVGVISIVLGPLALAGWIALSYWWLDAALWVAFLGACARQGWGSARMITDGWERLQEAAHGPVEAGQE